MLTRPNFRALYSSLAIFTCWMWLTAGSCGDGGTPTEPTLQDCPISYDNGWPSGASLSLSMPAHCPIGLTGATSYDFNAHIQFPASSQSTIPKNSNVETTIVNRLGQSSGSFIHPVWSQGWDSQGGYFVDLNGQYFAATGGFDTYNKGWDDVRNRFQTAYGTYLAATAKIRYFIGPPNTDLITPGSVDPGVTFQASASPHDAALVNPVTWSWYVNGQLYATTSSDATTIVSGDPGTTQEIRVVVADNYGHSSSSGFSEVYARTNCVDIYGNPTINCQ